MFKMTFFPKKIDASKKTQNQHTKNFNDKFKFNYLKVYFIQKKVNKEIVNKNEL